MGKKRTGRGDKASYVPTNLNRSDSGTGTPCKPNLLRFERRDAVEFTPIWEGYIQGLNTLSRGRGEAPFFAHSERNVSLEIGAWLAKVDPTLDAQDFATSVVSNWNEVRDYLSASNEGFEAIKAVPTIFTLRWYFNLLVEWFKAYLAHDRSTLFTYGIPSITATELKYISPPKEDIVTSDQALDYLLDEMLSKH